MRFGASTRSFFEDVYDVCRLIPEGRVTSYGAIAKYIGTGKSARMVGWAMHASFGVEPEVPAHRVVNSQGLLTGRMHFSDPSEMQVKLEAEGISVVEHQVKPFGDYFWDPAKELELD